MQTAEWNTELGQMVYREMTPEEEAAWILATTPVPPTPNEMRVQFLRAVQFVLDTFAVGWGYSGILDATSYAGEQSQPLYAAEGAALRKWRSDCRAYVDQKVIEYAGVKTMPPDSEILADMPVAPQRPVDPSPTDPVQSGD